MSSLLKVDDNWIPLQVKVFSRWVSSHLRNIDDQNVTDITKDLSNGVALVELATELTKKKPLRQWCQAPKRNVDMVQNCDLAIDMFTKDGVKLVGISGKDINDSNQKLILGLIWTLILYYSIGKSVNYNNPIQKTVKVNNNFNDFKPVLPHDDDSKNALLSWAIGRTSNYPNIHDFVPFDLSLCALLDSYVPEKINYYQLDPNNSRHNSCLAIEVMNDLGIPVYVFPDELARFNDSVDEKTLLTQLSAAKVVLDRYQKINVHKQPIHERDILLDEKQDFDSDSNQDDVERLTKELEEARAVAAKTKEENMKLSHALAVAEAEIENQKQANNHNEKEINKLIESQKQSDKESKQLKEALSDKEMELRAEQWEKSKVETEVNELSQTINKMRTDAEIQQEDKKKANDEVQKLLKAANDDAENSRKKLREELVAVQTEKDKLLLQQNVLVKKISDFKKQKEFLSKALKDVQEEKESAEKEVSRLTKDADEHHGNSKFIEEQLKAARKEKDKLESQIASLKKQIDDLKNENQLYAKALKNIQEEKEAAEDEVSRLTKEAHSTGSAQDARRLQNELKIAESGRKKAEADLSILSQKLDQIMNDRELLANTLRKVQVDKEKAESEVDRLSRAVVEAEARIALLEKSLEDSQKEVESHKQAHEFTQVNNNNLSQAYDELQEAMDAKISDLEGQVEWINAEKSEVESDAAVLAKALRDAGREKEKDEEEIGRLSRAVVEAEARNALLQKSLQDSQKQVVDLQEELYWTNDQNNEMGQDTTVLSNALTKKENEVKQLANDNFEARQYASVLTKQLARTKNEVQRQKEEKVNAQQKAIYLSENLDRAAAESRGNAQMSSVVLSNVYNEIERSRAVAQTYSNALDEALVQLQDKSDENAAAKQEIRNLSNELQEADDEVSRLTKAWQYTKSKYMRQSEELNSVTNEAELFAQSYSNALEELENEKRAREEAEKEVQRLNNELDQANDDIDMLNENLADTEIERDSLKNSLRKSQKRARREKNAHEEAELQAEQLAYDLAMTQAANNDNNNNNEDREVHVGLNNDDSPYYIKGDNKEWAGKTFGLTMTIDNEEYALAWIDDGSHFLNGAGYKLDLVKPNIENDIHQQFTFGKDEWNTVIDSNAKQGMVWDVANADNWNPPNGTAFYLYPFHGRHNQHFVYKDGMIYAKQNGQVVTYLGGNVPFVMVGPSEILKDKQTFHIQLL